MIASPRNPRRLLGAVASLGLVLVACRTPVATPTGELLERQVAFAPIVPDVADHTAAELAAAAMASNPLAPRDAETAAALQRLQAVDRVLIASSEAPSGLVPAAIDLTNAIGGDARIYRERSRELLERGDLDPALERRLELSRKDDPLVLARARLRDSWRIQFGRAFNAVVEPVGRSILTTAMAPYRIASSLVNYAVAMYREDALPLQRRQALVHWNEYSRRYPDSSETERLQPRIQSAEARRRRTERDRALAIAENALEAGQIRLALVYSQRALNQIPEDADAADLRDRTVALLEAQRAGFARSIEPSPHAEQLSPRGRELALALMQPEGDIEGSARALLAVETESDLHDEASFALVVAHGEAGNESDVWELLEEIAKADGGTSNMARHATAVTMNPESNSYGAFRAARSRDRRKRALWVFFGPWSNGPPDRGLPRPLEWLIGAPSAAQSLASTPLRLIQLPWAAPLPSKRPIEFYAERYLRLEPDGEYSEDVRSWLQPNYEDRDNWLGALRVAQQRPNTDEAELKKLREKAAEQSLAIARRQSRRDLRHAMYRRAAREFPDTKAGHTAGELARSEALERTPHSIRMTRGFLLENPRVAGPAGLGLQPQLLDENPANGELHEAGVALIGGLDIELSLLEGDEDGPPLRVQRTVSKERLARLVSLLEETSFRNSLVDPDDVVVANAQRDAFFERARLGLLENDTRATAQSNFRYRGMRERYGLVRGRESILPFELVLKGSISDMSFGAFPRISPPRETPDAFLYR